MAQDFDVSLKRLFRTSGGIVSRLLFGGPVVEWTNVELPAVRNPRVDLLAKGEDGHLRHVELESANSTTAGRRVAGYHLDLLRLLGEDVDMTLLYVGKEPMRLVPEFRTRSMLFRFRLVDASRLDGGALLKSDDLGDNMLAVLTRVEPGIVFEKVESRLRERPTAERGELARLFVLLSGLRGFAGQFARRFRMIDIMENEVLGPAILKGEATMLLSLVEERFGAVPAWVIERIESAKEPELLRWGRRVLRAKDLDEVFA